jgi:exopolysaccharide production protein ExoY
MAFRVDPLSDADCETGGSHLDSQDGERVLRRLDQTGGVGLFSLPVAEWLVVCAPPADVDEHYSVSLPHKIDEIAFRFADVILAAALLLLMSPVMILCWISVLLSGPGPAVFAHMRIGKNGQPFACYKFRTMVDGAEVLLQRLLSECEQSREEWAATQKLQNDPRITLVGRVLRRFSLDELPQLFNVLVGDMSMVGPRPIVKEEIGRYGEFFSDYCSVKPGLSGLWQVSGKNGLSYDERVRLDTEYARSKSLWLDALILWRTIPVVFLGRSF